MSWSTRIANVFRAQKVSTEIDDELRFHMAERVDDLMASGMTEEEARKEAARSLGNYFTQKDQTRDVDISRSLEAFVGDMRATRLDAVARPNAPTESLRNDHVELRRVEVGEFEKGQGGLATVCALG